MLPLISLCHSGPKWYYLAVEAYHRGDIVLVHEYGLVFLDLLKDLEQLLASNSNFLLGPWLEAAKALASTPQEEILYEFNARNQLTLWGPDGQILDYAGKITNYPPKIHHHQYSPFGLQLPCLHWARGLPLHPRSSHRLSTTWAWSGSSVTSPSSHWAWSATPSSSSSC